MGSDGRFLESRVGEQIYQSDDSSNCNRVNRLLHVNVSCNVGVISGSNDEQYLINFACKLGGILRPSTDDANINQDDTKSSEKLTKALRGNFFQCGQKARAVANVIWKIYWNVHFVVCPGSIILFPIPFHYLALVVSSVRWYISIKAPCRNHDVDDFFKVDHEIYHAIFQITSFFFLSHFRARKKCSFSPTRRLPAFTF